MIELLLQSDMNSYVATLLFATVRNIIVYMFGDFVV